MGTDANFFVGAYVKILKAPTTIVELKVHNSTCKPGCPNHKRCFSNEEINFCSKCGSPITVTITKVKEPMDLYDMMEVTKGKLIMAGDHRVLIPNTKNDFSVNLDEGDTESIVKMPGPNLSLRLINKYEKELDKLKALGAIYEVREGILVYHS